MNLKATKTQLWMKEIPDERGSLAATLEPLTAAGANFETVFARRMPDKPGSGLVFLTPLRGKKVLSAAQQAGFSETARVPAVKVEGDDKPGLVQALSRAVADAGVSLRGLHAAVIGRKCVAYLGFDSEDDAAKAVRAINALARAKKK